MENSKKNMNLNSTLAVRLSKTLAVDDGCRWIKHYCSRHRILLVGKGDFSFSACLAKAFRSSPNMVATSLDSLEFLEANYGCAPNNVWQLRSRKCTVAHEVDATSICRHPWLENRTFDRIIFNFPYARTKKLGLSLDEQLRRHTTLVSLFLENAMKLISEDGEIHVTHKTNGVYSKWCLESMASSLGLRLIEAVEFNLQDYPGYHPKRGFGGDKDFDCNPSKTYKFGLNLATM